MRLRESSRDLVFGCLSLLTSGLLFLESTSDKYVITAQDYGFNPVFFPRILLILWMLLSLVVVFRGVATFKRPSAEPADSLERPLLAFLLTCAYTVLMHIVGFLFSSVLFCAAFMLLFGYRRLSVVLPTAVVFNVLVWYIFTFTLGVVLPASPWFDRL